MKSNVEIVDKLSKERFDLLLKIRNLENFRLSEDWIKLSFNHKYLLDIQLQSMRTYIECLNARINDIVFKEENKWI